MKEWPTDYHSQFLSFKRRMILALGEVADPQDLFRGDKIVRESFRSRSRPPARKALAAEATARAYEEMKKMDDTTFDRS